METRKLVIVGSGPSGLTAAIYAARAELKPLVLMGSSWGGQLMSTTDVENFPGFPKGIQGPELIAAMVEQAERFGAELVYTDMESIEVDQRPFTINTTDKQYKTEAVIIATGARPRKLNIPGESEFWSKGVSSCATCDGAFFRDREVAVIGGGDSAMEEALFLTKFASKVYLIHRRDEYRASKIMQQRVVDNDKIERIMNTNVVEVQGSDAVEKLILEDVNSQQRRELSVQGMFLAIGHIPETEKLNGVLDVDELGYLQTVDHSMSSIEGIFIAGDVQDHRYRQAITAAGAGCMAAIDVERWMAE